MPTVCPVRLTLSRCGSPATRSAGAGLITRAAPASCRAPLLVERPRRKEPAMTTMTKLLLIMTAVLTIAPGAAFATDVMSTADGAVVSSRPQFVFDFTEGSARVELSRYADLKTAGDDAGAFVQQDAVDWLAIGPDDGFAPGMTRSWDGRIDAGRYFWHTWISSWVGDAYVSAWTLTRT